MISSMVSKMQRNNCLTLIKSLLEGVRDDDCLGLWDFVDLSEFGLDTGLSAEDFLAKLKVAKSASVGFDLYASIAEIVIS